MQVSSFFLVAFSTLFAFATSSSLHRFSRADNTLPLPLKTVFQFSNIPTWIENLAVRENGELILILLASNELYTVDPSQKEPTAKLITTISERTSLFSIAELEPDVFYVSAGNFSMMTGVLEPGSFCIFSVDLRDEAEVKVEKVLDMPDALLLNGMVGLRKERKLLIPDSYKGVVWGVDVEKKTYEVAVDVLETHADPDNGKTKVGVNGIKIHDGWLYFTNSNLASLFRVKFDAKKGCLASKGAEKLATDEVFMDDFAIDTHGVVWVTTNSGNVVLAVNGGKKKTVVVAGQRGGLEVAGPTACAFGRGSGEEHILFVVTTGGLGGGVDGGAKEGGKIIAVDTKVSRESA